jgi:KDO2-lipid IV(A) lauroyltransferase
MKTSHQLTYNFLTLLKRWTSTLSPKGRYKLANRLASLSYHFIPKRKRQIIKNLNRAFPNWSDKKVQSTVKKVYIFFMHNILQFFAFPKSWNGIEINVSGKEYLNSAMLQNKGCVFISAHFGAWELMAKWMGQPQYEFVGVAHRQKNRGANQFFQEQRELGGTEHIFRKEPFEKMESVLKNNGILALVSDQDAKRKGVFVNFFGSPASTPKGAALFHKKTGAPMLFCVCAQTGFQKYNLDFHPVNPINNSTKEITQAFTTLIEEKIREYPEQYFWFHRRWKTKEN